MSLALLQPDVCGAARPVTVEVRNNGSILSARITALISSRLMVIVLITIPPFQN
jgi:hypothetical protein